MRASMLLFLLAAGSLLSRCSSMVEENLALGRPSFTSSVATLPSSCNTSSHLEVDAGFANIADDCGCVITDGSQPPLTRDWYFVQLASMSRIRAVRVSGITSPFDVLVGHSSGSSTVSLDEFVLCSRYNTANNAANVSCSSPIMGSVVALRAVNDSSSLRLCEVEVFGNAFSNLLGLTQEIGDQLRLLDGDVSTCIETSPSQPLQPFTTTRLLFPDSTVSVLRVFVFKQKTSSDAGTTTASCGRPLLEVLFLTEYSWPTSYRGTSCTLLSSSLLPSVVEFECNCQGPCPGQVGIKLSGVQWRLCEVIAVAPEVDSLQGLKECAAPMGIVGLNGDLFADSAWSASSSGSSSSCSTPRFARYGRQQLTNAYAATSGGWCPLPLAQDPAAWIAVNLGVLFKIRAVLLQGGDDVAGSLFAGSYVTKFTVSSSVGSAAWMQYQQNGAVVQFTGPSHPAIPVLRSFSPELIASRIRLDAIEWYTYRCVRFELMGCPLVNREWTASPIRSLSGAFGIPNDAIQVSSIANSAHPKERMRMGTALVCGYVSVWVGNDAAPWVELKLSPVRTVHGIGWRERFEDFIQYISKYTLLYKMVDSDPFITFLPTSLDTYTGQIPSYVAFDHAFDASTIRLMMLSGFSHYSTQLELYTAPVTPTVISREVDSSCPSGYRAVSGYGCYRYINQSMAYTAAEQFCANDGAHLAHITDYDEWKAVTTWLPKPNRTVVYNERKKANSTLQYLGCFADTSARDLGDVLACPSMVTSSLCAQICLDSGPYNYLGLQDSSCCLCGTRAGLYGKIAESQCSMACTGDSTVKCGGPWINSVYFLGNWTWNPNLEWTYKGCFIDTVDSDLSGVSTTSSAMKIDVCISFCVSQGFYRYIAVQVVFSEILDDAWVSLPRCLRCASYDASVWSLRSDEWSTKANKIFRCCNRLACLHEESYSSVDWPSLAQSTVVISVCCLGSSMELQFLSTLMFRH